jgi:hypothetical protein
MSGLGWKDPRSSTTVLRSMLQPETPAMRPARRVDSATAERLEAYFAFWLSFSSEDPMTAPPPEKTEKVTYDKMRAGVRDRAAWRE